MAADDDEIGQLQIAAQKLYADNGPGLHDLFVAADNSETICPAERGNATRALPHRVRR